MAFPGNSRVFDFPTGNVSVFIDTDAARERRQFMEFWSDYRFAEVTKWREQPTPEWGHSPEGRCVADAGVVHDKGHHLKWFQYVVKKRAGCFEAGAVRVSVSTMNTGDLEPYVEYPKSDARLPGGQAPVDGLDQPQYRLSQRRPTRRR